jgi:uncharacterized protein with HEPN domain
MALGIAVACSLLDQFRNRLIHGYAAVLNDVVWGIFETDLPSLRREVSTLLKEGGETP